MADFGHTTRSLSPVEYNHSDSRTASLFFPGNFKENHSDNKNFKNGTCEDCLEESPKSKAISTQENPALEQTKLNFSREAENSMFHDFGTSTTFWSPANVEDVFVQSAIPQPVNGIHLQSNTPVITQRGRMNGPNNITTTMNHQPRRPVPLNSPFITQTKSVPTMSSLGGWNQQTQSVSGWPSQQHNSWGNRHSNHAINAINFPHGRSSRPSSLTLPSSSRRNHRSNHALMPHSRSAISTQSITQGLQSLSLSRQPVDGTILDDISSLGNSHGQNSELSNSLYPFQVMPNTPCFNRKYFPHVLIRTKIHPMRQKNYMVISFAFRPNHWRLSFHRSNWDGEKNTNNSQLQCFSPFFFSILNFKNC